MAAAPTAVVAGGGPVGAFAAIALAQQGWNVEVYDKWSLPASRPSSHDSRAYMLNLTSRALRAFKPFDVDVTPLVAPHGGLVETTFYDNRGGVVRTFKMPVKDSPTMLRVFRDEIGRLLIDEAHRLHPDKIKFHFGAPIDSVNLEKQTVSVSQSSVKEVHYDLLVGADGANSVVRAQLQNMMPPDYIRRFRHKGVYSTAGVAVPADELPGHAFFELHGFEAGAILWTGRGDGDVRTGFFTTQHVADQIRAGDTKSVHNQLLKTCNVLI